MVMNIQSIKTHYLSKNLEEYNEGIINEGKNEKDHLHFCMHCNTANCIWFTDSTTIPK